MKNRFGTITLIGACALGAGCLSEPQNPPSTPNQGKTLSPPGEVLPHSLEDIQHITHDSQDAARSEMTMAQEAHHPPSKQTSTSPSTTELSTFSSQEPKVDDDSFIPLVLPAHFAHIDIPSFLSLPKNPPSNSHLYTKGPVLSSLLGEVTRSTSECQHIARTADRAFLFHLDHLSMREELKGEVAERATSLFLSIMDPEKKYFLAEDEDLLHTRYRSSLGPLLARGNCQIVSEVEELMSERVAQSVGYYREFLEDGQALPQDPTPSSPSTSFATNEADLKSRLLSITAQRYHNLREAMPHRDSEEIMVILDRHAAEQLEYERKARQHTKLAFLQALLRSLDPHSAYYPTAENAWDHDPDLFHFQQEDMSFMAIPHEGYFQVVHKLSSSSYSGPHTPLKDGDKVYAIRSKGTTSWNWVAGFHRLKDHMNTIEGPIELLVRRPMLKNTVGKGTTFSTVVHQTDHNPHPLTDVEQRAQGYTYQLEDHKGKQEYVGVLRIPLFYRQGKEKHHIKVSEDVRDILLRMSAKDVSVLLIDLRGNGGGFMWEAVRVAYMLMSPETLGQSQRKGVYDYEFLESTQDIGVLMAPDPLFRGPVVVLTDRFTASASEFLAQSLQTHGRALVVGDSHTYGKGTLQNTVTLQGPTGETTGMLHITTGRFFDVDGQCVQLEGLEPHIIIPSHSGLLVDSHNEQSHEHALSRKSVPAKLHHDLGWVSESYQAPLAQRSRYRVMHSKDFYELSAAVPRERYNSTSFKGLEWFKAYTHMSPTELIQRITQPTATSSYGYLNHSRHKNDSMLTEAMNIAADYSRMVRSVYDFSEPLPSP